VICIETRQMKAALKAMRTGRHRAMAITDRPPGPRAST
jgi:hypothetical protein